MRIKDRHVIWPVYFDAAKSRRYGRRVSLRLAIQSPSREDIDRAATRLGLAVESDAQAAFPSAWWDEKGCVTVGKSMPKARLIRQLAEELRRAKAGAERSPTRAAQK